MKTLHDPMFCPISSQCFCCIIDHHPWCVNTLIIKQNVNIQFHRFHMNSRAASLQLWKSHSGVASAEWAPIERNGWALVSHSIVQPHRLMLITRVQRLMISLRVKSIRAQSPCSASLNIGPCRGKRSMTTPEAGAWSNYTCVAASIHLASWHAHRSINPFVKSRRNTVMESERERDPGAGDTISLIHPSPTPGGYHSQAAVLSTDIQRC